MPFLDELVALLRHSRHLPAVESLPVVSREWIDREAQGAGVHIEEGAVLALLLRRCGLMTLPELSSVPAWMHRLEQRGCTVYL